MSNLGDSLEIGGSNAIDFTNTMLSEASERRKEQLVFIQEKSSTDNFTRKLSPGEDNDSFYCGDSNETCTDIDLEQRETKDNVEKDIVTAKTEVVNTEKMNETELSSSCDTTSLLMSLEKCMGEVYLSKYSKQTEVKIMRKIYEALKPFNRDFSQFLVFMTSFTKDWYVERPLFIMFITCLMLDNPENYTTCFDSNYFSNTAQNGYGDLIDAFIAAAKEFTND